MLKKKVWNIKKSVDINVFMVIKMHENTCHCKWSAFQILGELFI